MISRNPIHFPESTLENIYLFLESERKQNLESVLSKMTMQGFKFDDKTNT